MARQTAHKVAVTTEEFTWVQKEITKRAAQVKEGEKNRELLALVKFAEKLAEPSELLNMNRVEARILQKIVANTIATLNDKIIPGYEEKGLTEYKKAAQVKQANAERLLEKIERVL